MANLKVKAVILCGGQGTRIRDVSEVLPKPMLTIGNMPIVWHIMKIYAHYGIKDFVLCLGYKGWIVKEFFLNYNSKISDISIKLGDPDSIKYYSVNSESDWDITLVETGEIAQTGARIWNVRKYLEDCDMFSVTYGDGVANVNDAHPSDSDRWENDDNVEQSESGINLWILIVILVSIITIAGVIIYILKKRKEKEVEQSSEDDLGRVEKGEMEESE